MTCPYCQREIDEKHCATGYRRDKGQGYICQSCKIIVWQEEENKEDG